MPRSVADLRLLPLPAAAVGAGEHAFQDPVRTVQCSELGVS